MKLIIGLGNLGKEYEQTRHNIGFLCLTKLATAHKLSFKTSKNYKFVKYKESILMMPQTYMNASGEAYRTALNKYKHFDEVLVIMDDIDLPIGEIRIRVSGGSGGHNGLKSILEEMDTLDVMRIRIGIGRPEKGTPRKHVLDIFNAEEREIIETTLSTLTDLLDLYISTDSKRLLDAYSKTKLKPIPSAKDGINRPKEDQHD